MKLRETRNILCGGESIAITTATHTKWDYSIGFNCQLSEDFKELTLSRGKNKPWCSAYVTIDTQTVSIHKFTTTDVHVGSIEHGLNIKDFLYCTLTAQDNNTAKLILTSSSGSFVQNIEWNASNGDIMAETSSELTNCELIYTVNAINRSLWIFGDSYFDFWTRIVCYYGYNSFMEDAHSGRQSKAAIGALKEYLNYGTPQKIVWFMGMNDPDRDEINPNYKESVDELIALCNKHEIELVVSRIPTTTARDHSYKNEYLRSLGIPCLELDRALGVKEDGTWFDGLLREDQVHPTPLGTRAIASYVINALPEITKQ